MKLQSVVTDNIAEVLVKIIEFTQARQKVLIRNINNIGVCGFEPEDMPVVEFSHLMNNAINEHITNQRLLLCDTENIKFGIGGSFEVKAVTDKTSRELLEENQDAYLEQQIQKLLENSLNQKIAAGLLRKKQQQSSESSSGECKKVNS